MSSEVVHGCCRLGCGGDAAAGINEAENLWWWDCAMVDEERWNGSGEEGMIAARIVFSYPRFFFYTSIFSYFGQYFLF